MGGKDAARSGVGFGRAIVDDTTALTPGSATANAPGPTTPVVEEARLDPAGVTALVPCHREPPSAALLTGIAAAVGRLVVVDDGVPEAVRPRLASLVAAAGGCVRRAGGPGGKGSAIASSIEWLQSNGEAHAVLVMDADGQHPPATIPAFLTAAARAELVVGDRFGDQRRMPLVRRVSNLVASQLLAARTGVEVSDSQCGMRLLRGRALHEFPPGRGGYEAESEHLKRCLLAGVSVEWVPIPAIYDGEASSFRGLRDGARVAWTLVR